MLSTVTNELPLSQAAQLYSIGQEKALGQESLPFMDNYDYLHALEQEARLLVVMSYIHVSGQPISDEAVTKLKELCTLLHISVDIATSEKITEKYNKICNMNRMREDKSKDSGIKLIFNDLCNKHCFSEFERNVLMIMLMLYISRDFRKILKLCGYGEEERADILKIGTLLSILCRNFRDQLSSLHAFSLDGKLISEEFIVYLSSYMKDTTNILDKKLCISERATRYIIGDSNIYHPMFAYINREKSNVRIEQVVLPVRMKDDILANMANFLKSKKEKRDFLDKFFGYGTGLVLFFHGPSGTGKTMLAHALANHFNCQIFSIDATNLRIVPESYQKMFSTLFKEASFQNAIVFFDEADDLFEQGTYISRALLIEIEKSNCISIFSTNKSTDLDPALERRLSMKSYFSFPDENARHELWKRLLPANVTCASDIDLRELAERYKFTGGIIKNTIFLAVNESLNSSNNKKPILTRSMLINAAELQSQSMSTDSHICRTYSPKLAIADLPIRKEQKKDLYAIAMVYEKMKKNRLGFNLLVCASDIAAGNEVSQGLAGEFGLKIKEFNYFEVIMDSKDNQIIDPYSQRKITPLEYAFSKSTGDNALTVFLDYGGFFKSSMEDEKSEHMLMKHQILLREMKRNENAFCMVTLPMKSHSIPFEFNFAFELEYPPEDMQLVHWKQYLTGGKVDDDELRRIIRHSPMHISEISFIGQHISIQSIIRSNLDNHLLMNAEEVISRYRKKRHVPLLFGARD